MSVLHAALRTISTMFDTMRKHLKLQQELFLAFTIDRLAPPPLSQKQLSKRATYSNSPRPGTPAPETPLLGPPEPDNDGSTTQSRPLVPPAYGQTRDLLLETLSQIARHPSFMADIYANYDCDVNSENLLERLMDFLTKVTRPSTLPNSADVTSSQYIRRIPWIYSSRTLNSCLWIFFSHLSTIWQAAH